MTHEDAVAAQDAALVRSLQHLWALFQTNDLAGLEYALLNAPRVVVERFQKDRAKGWRTA